MNDRKPSPSRAVVLLSGGLDSATALAIAVAEGYEAHCLTVRYGQRHASELQAAQRVAGALGATELRTAHVDLRAFGGSALTDDIPVPTGCRDPAARTSIPPTYVPARNTVFLAVAAAYAETLDARDLFIGVNSLDCPGYPDCSVAFLDAFEKALNVGTRAGVEGRPFRIHAPLAELSKGQIIARGAELGIDYADTVSCYRADGEGRACGTCDSCVLRRKGFEAAGVPDPTRYV
jgi:7-cyano-7-deazaguanine synthase